MVRALAWFVMVCCLVRAQAIKPETLLTDLHSEAKQQPLHDRLVLLNFLAIAATGADPTISRAWSLEMFELAASAPHEQRWQQMDQAADRKNALTVLALTDPELAAQHFLELEPSAGHLPNEDPRIDLARNLFPRLWAKRGEGSLPTILRLADFTSRTGQYPYVAIGHILPSLAKIDPPAAHSLLLAAVHRLGEEYGIWRTPEDYLHFLRESWPVLSHKDRHLAVEAALAVVHRGVEDKASTAPGSHSYAEYYLSQATVRLDSEEAARIYDLLPFVYDVDATWGRRVRQQYPILANVPLLPVAIQPWRSGVFAAAGRDTPDRVQSGFERHHLIFLAQWAKEDSKRAAALAQATTDPARRRAALSLVLPAYAKVDPVQAETWRREIMASEQTARTPDDLTFLVSLARAHFALGHPEDAERVTVAAMRLGEQFASKRDRSLPVDLAEGADDLHDLALTYGEYHFDDLAAFVRQCKDQDPALRLYVLAGAVRGALRHRPGYQEPN